jgi:AcrR family transcriptional regulator
MSMASITEHPQKTRFARRRLQTRRDLVAAAERVFAARGYHQSKISDIAAEADVGIGTFYLHYESKEAVFLQLVEETAGRLKQAIDAAKSAVEEPAEVARLSCAVLFRFAHENRDTFRILFGEGTFNHAIRSAQRIFTADIAENLVAGMRTGSFAPYPTALVTHAVIGLITQVVSWWITQDDVSLEEAVDATNRFVASGLSPLAP